MDYINYTGEEFSQIYNKVYNDVKITFDEFLVFLQGYGEIEFYHKHIHYVLGRSNDTYNSASKYWDKSKSIFTLRKIHELPKEAQRYNSIEEFAHKANINGKLLRDIWDEVKDVNPQ